MALNVGSKHESQFSPSSFVIPTLFLAGVIAASWIVFSKPVLDGDGVPWLGGDRAYFDPNNPEHDVCNVCKGLWIVEGKPCPNCWRGVVIKIGGAAFLTLATFSVTKKKRGKKKHG